MWYYYKEKFSISGGLPQTPDQGLCLRPLWRPRDPKISTSIPPYSPKSRVSATVWLNHWIGQTATERSVGSSIQTCVYTARLCGSYVSFAVR